MGMFDQPRGMFVVDDRDQSTLGGLIADYLRNVVTGQIAAQGPLGQNFYDPNRSFAQNALDPRALANATDIGLSLGTGPIRAYHGSPYDFDKFDLAKIGTGEGAQAYGHGLYFAESEPVARSYRDTLRPSGVEMFQGEKPIGMVPSGHVVNDPAFVAAYQKLMPVADVPDWIKSTVMRDIREVGSDVLGKDVPLSDLRAATISRVTKDLAFNPASQEHAVAAVNRAYDSIPPDISFRRPGRMYEVNIHADPDAFLNWDKPLSGQGENVKQFIRDDMLAGNLSTRLVGRNPNFGDMYDLLYNKQSIGVFPEGKITGDLADLALQHMPTKGRDAYVEMSMKKPGYGVTARDAATSAALRDAGIPGIKYLDQGSRGAGGGTSNYVVFNPSIIEILRKYGILGPVIPGSLAPFMGDNQ